MSELSHLVQAEIDKWPAERLLDRFGLELYEGEATEDVSHHHMALRFEKVTGDAVAVGQAIVIEAEGSIADLEAILKKTAEQVDIKVVHIGWAPVVHTDDNYALQALLTVRTTPNTNYLTTEIARERLADSLPDDAPDGFLDRAIPQRFAPDNTVVA